MAFKEISKYRVLPQLNSKKFHPYLLSEYLTDPDIRFSESDILIVRDDVLRALEYLHQTMKVQHGSVKPEYILIEEVRT